MLGNGQWTDLITDFMSYTEAILSPEIFRLWTGISMVAGSLERRVWAKIEPRPTFPNLYVFLVAPPGVGKQVIDEMKDLWAEAEVPDARSPAFHIAPDSMTKASLIDTLVKAKTVRLSPGPGPAREPLTYSSLLIAAPEFQNLLPAYDPDYISVLDKVWDNPEKPHVEVRRTGEVKEVSIEHPQINLIAGVQPSYFVSTFPEHAWATGFARRTIMVYSGETPFRELFTEVEFDRGLRAKILARLGHLSTVYGNCRWAPDAAAELALWHRRRCPPVPSHSKLEHYCRSRTQQVVKLCVVSALSRTGEREIQLVDVKRALAWLIEAERLMPDVFREMIGRSDAQVIEELRLYAWQLWNKRGRKPLKTDDLYVFLAKRVPSEKVEKILMVVDKSDLIVRSAGFQDQWIPRPRMGTGGGEIE